MGRHNDLGKIGEAIARSFLEKKGHIILFTNFRFEHNEIDIISQSGDILIFTEIKTRSNIQYSFPEESVNFKKQTSIKKVATSFLIEHPEFLKTRFDVISILIHNEKVKEIRHFEDAFY